jgi:IS30 family transposase
MEVRGVLCRDLLACLRFGRALRVPPERARHRGRSFINETIMISERPPEIEDRAIHGHWEGDLILCPGNSAISTLVERTSRFTMLLHLLRMDSYQQGPCNKNRLPLVSHGVQAVRCAIKQSIQKLLTYLRQSLI